MNAAMLLVRCLEHEGVRFIFGVPGEETLELTDALLDARIQVVATRHEQAAAFMADVYGRLSGEAGVCFSTLGPGATNLLTGVADAYLDHAPLVTITGQASLNRRHKESHQYIDAIAMFKPVTKWNASIPRADVIPEAVRKAFKIAQTEKPGATHLELPEDVAEQSIADEAALRPLAVQAPVMPEPSPSQVQRAVRAISGAKRPVILAGNGVIRRNASEVVRSFARAFQIPVLQTFMAKGVMPDSDPLSLHTLGLTARDYAALVMEQADVVLAIGYDFVEYAPCFWNPRRDKHIVHVDGLPAEVDEHYIVDVGELGDLRLSLPLIQKQLSSSSPPSTRHGPGRPGRRSLTGLRPSSLVLRRGRCAPSTSCTSFALCSEHDDVVVCDVGAHKLWMARMFPCETPNSCIVSNGFAAMGIAVPGAIAAKLLYPQRRVVAVTGDGGFMMNSQELETAVRLKLPLVILIWRDNGYGVIRWKQQVRFGRTSSVDFGNPDFVRYAESFGAAGYRVTAPTELRPILEQALQLDVPAVIDCPVDDGENLRLTKRLQALPVLQ